MRERNLGFIFWLAVFVCSCVSSSVQNPEDDGKNRQTYVIRYRDGEQTIPVTVVLDYKKQTEYVINMNPRTPAKSVTLYDFKQRTIAYKDLTNKECFLGRLTYETLSEENNALQDVKNPVEVRPKVRSLDPRKPALTPTEIRNIAGQKTAVFCRKMNTWLLMPEKSHSIGKREADDYEERTFQYHGHRSSQYSHFERETRRRVRNRNQASFRRRAQRKENEPENENGRLLVPDSNPVVSNLSFPHSSYGIHSIPGYSDFSNNAATNHRVRQKFSSLDQSNLNDGEGRSSVPNAGRPPSRASNHEQNFRYPNFETKSFSSDGDSVYSSPAFHKSYDLNSNETNEDLVLDHKVIPGFSANATKQQKLSSFLEKLTSDNETPTTTNAPSIPYGPASYPNVHSSLVHLLPLYKPLSEEFDFDDQKFRTESPQSNQQSNIEREDHSSPKIFIDPYNRLNHLPNENDGSHDPDVSVNVLEIPRITKEFENVRGNETDIPLLRSENAKQFHKTIESYPLRAPTHSNNSPYIKRNNLSNENDTRPEHLHLSPNENTVKVVKESFFNENNFHVPHSKGPTTTGLPIFTVKEYPTAERTTPKDLYSPSVHTAFKNSEDIDSFQIFPNYIENNITPVNKRNLSTHHDDSDRFPNQIIRKIPHPLAPTTEYPFKQEKQETNANNRSDTTNEDITDQSPFTPVAPDIRRDFHLTFNNTPDKNENIPSYKPRYQSALRDFKPDEIVIDIENVPTHTPPPITTLSNFRQRVPITTIQPTIKSSSSSEAKSYGDKRSDQISGTTWRSSYQTTRYPRRTVSDKTRRHNVSVSLPQRVSLNHYRYQLPKHPAKANQLFGVNQFTATHSSNRRPFYYPGRPIPPHTLHVPGEINQLHHVSHLNNLPPGVSVHPRHPQAPFADMVHSNRPPTIPLVDDNQALQHHRQRHHRKKERHQNSCCRLRGQSSAFQSCCRNGGPCCARSRRRMHLPGEPCCSSSNAIGQVISPNQIQPPVRTTNQILPPIRTEKTHRSEVDNRDRCQKEKMCRTLYESTQQVMVCRNADIEGC